jgi:hypothetical protein
MKRMLVSGVLGLALAALATAQAEEKKPAAAAMKPGHCTFADVAKVKKHTAEHVTYPAKGAAIKLTCKKEIPDEFSKDEWACMDGSLKDDQEYKSAADVLKAYGVK